MTRKEVIQIRSLLTDAWEDQAKRAARALWTAGFSSDDLREFSNTPDGRMIHSAWHTNTYNELWRHEHVDESK